MAYFLIEGEHTLEGEVSCKGSKNSVLPILSASLLCPFVKLENVPCLSDVNAALEILKYLGCKVAFSGHTVEIDTKNITNRIIHDDLSSKMRSSILFSGSLLSKFGSSSVSLPGGCDLGKRPVDFHIEGFKALGYESSLEDGIIKSRVLKSGREDRIVNLPFPSVGATENIILASILKEGSTEILFPAQEPEIDDLISFINKAGGKVRRGRGSIHIEGVEKLHEAEFKIMPDRIEAATFMAIGASNGGNIHILDCKPRHFRAFTDVIEAMGCRVKLYKNSVYLSAPKKLKAVRKIETGPYPAFPTDCQAIIMSCLIKSSGESVIKENVFSQRFKEVSEFISLGADIVTDRDTAKIRGREKLKGNTISAFDLRGGAAAVNACLSSEGISRVYNISHIERGYDNFAGNLKALGAYIDIISGEKDEESEKENQRCRTC